MLHHLRRPLGLRNSQPQWSPGQDRTASSGTVVSRSAAAIERYANLSTGASVVRDLSATAVYAYNEDGTPASLTSLHGPFGATMPAGSTPESGILVLSGKGTSVTSNADGTRSFTLGKHGTASTVCDDLD